MRQSKTRTRVLAPLSIADIYDRWRLTLISATGAGSGALPSAAMGACSSAMISLVPFSSSLRAYTDQTQTQATAAIAPRRLNRLPLTGPAWRV